MPQLQKTTGFSPDQHNLPARLREAAALELGNAVKLVKDANLDPAVKLQILASMAIRLGAVGVEYSAKKLLASAKRDYPEPIPGDRNRKLEYDCAFALLNAAVNGQDARSRLDFLKNACAFQTDNPPSLAALQSLGLAYCTIREPLTCATLLERHCYRVADHVTTWREWAKWIAEHPTLLSCAQQASDAFAPLSAEVMNFGPPPLTCIDLAFTHARLGDAESASIAIGAAESMEPLVLMLTHEFAKLGNVYGTSLIYNTITDPSWRAVAKYDLLLAGALGGDPVARHFLQESLPLPQLLCADSASQGELLRGLTHLISCQLRAGLPIAPGRNINLLLTLLNDSAPAFYRASVFAATIDTLAEIGACQKAQWLIEIFSEDAEAWSCLEVLTPTTTAANRFVRSLALGHTRNACRRFVQATQLSQ